MALLNLVYGKQLFPCQAYARAFEALLAKEGEKRACRVTADVQNHRGGFCIALALIAARKTEEAAAASHQLIGHMEEFVRASFGIAP